MPFDAIILGAGPAGCAAAYDLARAGGRVLLLDRRNFPRAKACACGLTRKTLAALRYSVDPIAERRCNEIILQPDSLDRTQDIRLRSRKPIAAMAVRSRFDKFCLDQTLAAGRNGGSVTFRKIETALALRDLGTHIELDIRSADQPFETLTAPVLIGADGSNGVSRRLALTAQPQDRCHPDPERAEGEQSAVVPAQSPGWYHHGFALEATIPYALLPPRLPANDAPLDLIFDFAPLPGGYGWLFPKADHINIGVGAFADPGPPAGASARRGGEGDPALLKTVTRQLLATYTQAKLGVDLATLPAATVTGQHLGMGGKAYIPRGRILLTGDAAGLVDPLTGEGIHSAIISGQAAAAAILETTLVLSGRSFSSATKSLPEEGASDPDALATAYIRHLRPLQQTLAFSARAAHAFYRTPDRGFRAMRNPFLRRLILRTYTDGLPHTALITTLARFFAR